VNAAIRTDNGVLANSGIGFAIPVNTVRRVVPQLIETGSVSYAYLGVSVDNTFSIAELATVLKLPVDHGVLIGSVAPNGPAEQAGLKGGNKQRAFAALPCRPAETLSPPWTAIPSGILMQ